MEPLPRRSFTPIIDARYTVTYEGHLELCGRLGAYVRSSFAAQERSVRQSLSGDCDKLAQGGSDVVYQIKDGIKLDKTAGCRRTMQVGGS